MDIRAKGLVVASRDIGEKDKLLTILTLEYGKLTCKARGVKAPKSKLKMQTQPFCFADFEMVKSGGNYTLTGGNIIDSFFDFPLPFSSLYMRRQKIWKINFTI